MSISTCHVSKTRLNISEGTRREQQLLVVTYKLVSNPQIIAMSSPGHFRPGLMRCCTVVIKRPFYFFLADRAMATHSAVKGNIIRCCF